MVGLLQGPPWRVHGVAESGTKELRYEGFVTNKLIQWAEADAGLTDDCQMRVCSRNMCKAKCKSFGAPPNTLRSLKHQVVWLAVIKSLKAWTGQKTALPKNPSRGHKVLQAVL